MSDNLQDLRDWRTLGLPVNGNWNTGGHGSWHVPQVKAGHRLIPSVRLPQYAPPGTLGSWASNPKSVRNLTEFGDWAFMNDNHLPICIRTNNIPDVFSMAWYRPPIAPGAVGPDISYLPDSPLVWREIPGGLDTRGAADCFGPLSNWTGEGSNWGNSIFVQQLQVTCPNPAFVIFLENNESKYFNPKLMYDVKLNEWKPDPRTNSIRMADWLLANPGKKLADFLPTHYQLRAAQFKALYDAFEATLTPDWQGKTITAAYGGLGAAGQPNESDSYDCSSLSRYVGGGVLSDFTGPWHAGLLDRIPAFEAKEAVNPDWFREVSTNVASGGALNGAIAGKHLPISPKIWGDRCALDLWFMQSPGIPVCLRHWEGNLTKPTDLMFWDKDTDPVTGAVTLTPLTEKLAAAGVPEWVTLTIDDYEQAEMNVVDKICEVPEIREFWLGGTHIDADTTSFYKRLLDCNLNTPRAQWINKNGTLSTTASIKVWAVALKLDTRYLVYAFTPCNLTTAVVVVPGVGDVTLNFNGKSSVYEIGEPPVGDIIWRELA